jgi:hypothetical protein
MPINDIHCHYYVATIPTISSYGNPQTVSAGNSCNKSLQDPELEIARKYVFKMLANPGYSIAFSSQLGFSGIPQNSNHKNSGIPQNSNPGIFWNQFSRGKLGWKNVAIPDICQLYFAGVKFLVGLIASDNRSLIETVHQGDPVTHITYHRDILTPPQFCCRTRLQLPKPCIPWPRPIKPWVSDLPPQTT